MIRTVWLAAVCLVVLGAMAIGKTAKAPAPITDETSMDGATVDADLVQEPLIKADRLQITYVRQETPSQSTVPPMDPIHWHDPNATNLLAAKSKQSVTAKKTKSAADSKDTQAADRSKANAQTKRCDQAAAFSGLLRSLNLAPACDS
jgi:hypothetical protein